MHKPMSRLKNTIRNSKIMITYLLKSDILIKEKTWVMSFRMKKEGTYGYIDCPKMRESNIR